MKTVLYLDVLLLVNFLVDYCLLGFTARITGADRGFFRQMLGAVLGALSSLVILCPEWPFLLQLVYQLAVCLAMVRAAFGPASRGAFLVRVLWLWLSGMTLAGSTMLWLMYGQPRGVETNNLVVYLYIAPWKLVLSAAGLYLALHLWLLLYGRQMPKPLTRLKIDLGFGTLWVWAMLDSGFSMRDPFGGYPVVMVDYQAVVRQLPERLVVYLEDWFQGRDAIPDRLNIRLLPCQTATGQALLPGITAKIERKPIFLVFSGQRVQIPRAQALYGWELGLIR